MSEVLILGLLALAVVVLLVGLAFWLRSKKLPPTNEMLLSHTFTHILEGNHRGVLERMRRLYKQSGHDVGIGLALGNLLRSLGKNQVAIRTHKSLASRLELTDEVAALIHTELAADYLAGGLLERARESLERALDLQKPDELLARYGEQIYERLGEWDTAAKTLAAYGKYEEVEVSDRIALLRCRQAEKAWEYDELAEANSALKKAFSAQKNCLPAYLLNARLLRESGKPEKARAYLNKHIAQFEGKLWTAMEEYKQITIQDGQTSLFLDAVEKHLEQEPDDWRTRAVLAHFLADIGEVERAADALLTCLEYAPRILTLHQKLWSLLLRTGDLKTMERYRTIVKEELIFSKPYRCEGCMHESETLLWRCPSCYRIYSYTERKI